MSRLVPYLLSLATCASGFAQSSAPSGPPPMAERISSHRQPPAYPVPYEPSTPEEIKAVLDRVLAYLEGATPVRILDLDTNASVADPDHLPPHVGLDRGEFFINSYEWGVTYNGMLTVAEITGDARYREYTAARLHAIASVAAHLQADTQSSATEPAGAKRMQLLRGVLAPRSLDDSGALDTAMLKAARAGVLADVLKPWIENYTRWIAEKQFRLPDQTLARNRPHPNTLWLDDLYMSVPALAQAAAWSGNTHYLDDAARQVLQFSERLFVTDSLLYRHGWVQDMDPHPNFFWARANGWAVVAMAELLTVLPETHPQRQAVLKQFRAHVAGIASRQSGSGLWHQLLDRPDSYLETSASAMFCYAIARGINRGWLDPLAYGPMVSLAWNAVAKQVNAKGQVENTCVGTGMGFDPAFYYHRPVSVYAAHGYGPVLLAGAEMIALMKGAGNAANINDGSLQFAPSPSHH